MSSTYSGSHRPRNTPGWLQLFCEALPCASHSVHFPSPPRQPGYVSADPRPLRQPHHGRPAATLSSAPVCWPHARRAAPASVHGARCATVVERRSTRLGAGARLGMAARAARGEAARRAGAFDRQLGPPIRGRRHAQQFVGMRPRTSPINARRLSLGASGSYGAFPSSLPSLQRATWPQISPPSPELDFGARGWPW